MSKKLHLLVGAGSVVLSGFMMLAVNAAEMMAGPNVVNVVATEYKFEMPDGIPAGPTLFHLVDNGNELHHMTLVKLEQGKTLADFAALPPGPMPSWAVFVGGPNTPVPHGGQVDVTVDLSPGNYAAICLIPGPDGKPHVMNGMAKAFTVTSSSEARAMPASDLTLTLTDFQFSFSKPVTTGKHSVRVVNNGPQLHEAEIFKLQPGKKGEDVLKWMEGGLQGPPPGMPVAGIAPEEKDRENILQIDLSSGDYAILCFMPDANGKLHAMLGMIYDFQVM